MTRARRYNELNHKRFPPGTEGRPFAYFVLMGGRFLYASAIRVAVLKVVMSLSVRDVHTHTHIRTRRCTRVHSQLARYAVGAVRKVSTQS